MSLRKTQTSHLLKMIGAGPMTPMVPTECVSGKGVMEVHHLPLILKAMGKILALIEVRGDFLCSTSYAIVMELLCIFLHHLADTAVQCSCF